MKAEGKWAWWNQYGPVPIETCVRRAGQVDGVIVKAGYWDVQAAFQQAGVRVGAESYVLPYRSRYEANMLAEMVGRGAEFVVVNAEVEWEHLLEADQHTQMVELMNAIAELAPGVEIYASTDTRAGRTQQPYQRVLGYCATAWMPMIYPLAFDPDRVGDWVARAFHSCLDLRQDFQGKPVLPTIQTYGGIGAGAVTQEIAECHERKLQGWQAYTICHASLDEWRVVAEAGGAPYWPECRAAEEVQEELEHQAAVLQVGGMFSKAHGYSLCQQPLPATLKGQLRWLLGQPEE